MASPETTISTLRFCCLPTAVSLLATGSAGPPPLAVHAAYPRFAAPHSVEIAVGREAGAALPPPGQPLRPTFGLLRWLASWLPLPQLGLVPPWPQALPPPRSAEHRPPAVPSIRPRVEQRRQLYLPPLAWLAPLSLLPLLLPRWSEHPPLAELHCAQQSKSDSSAFWQYNLPSVLAPAVQSPRRSGHTFQRLAVLRCAERSEPHTRSVEPWGRW